MMGYFGVQVTCVNRTTVEAHWALSKITASFRDQKFFCAGQGYIVELTERHSHKHVTRYNTIKTSIMLTGLVDSLEYRLEVYRNVYSCIWPDAYYYKPEPWYSLLYFNTCKWIIIYIA